MCGSMVDRHPISYRWD